MEPGPFNPLIFLMPLGSGGFTVMPFALFQIPVEPGTDFITRAQMDF